MTRIVSKAGFIPDPFAGTPITSLAEYAGGGALLLSVEDDASLVAHQFDTVHLIVIPFDGFTDGRGFSLARSLRALGYEGHLRASGHVLVDQFRAALRCGFDDVEISREQALRNPEPQWREVSLVPGYQAHLTAGNARP